MFCTSDRQDRLSQRHTRHWHRHRQHGRRILSGNKIEYGLIPLGSIGMTCTGLALGSIHVGMIGSLCCLGLSDSGPASSPFPSTRSSSIAPPRRIKAASSRPPICSHSSASPSPPAPTSSSPVHSSRPARHHRGRFGHYRGRHGLRSHPAAGVVRPPHPLPRHAHHLPRQVLGRDNFPEKSGALLVCNHMSFVDVALLIASTDRPIRFLMYKGIYDTAHQAFREDDEGDSHLQRAASA